MLEIYDYLGIEKKELLKYIETKLKNKNNFKYIKKQF